MKRTQIYLNNGQYNNLLVESKKSGKTMSDLIREAVDYRFGIKKKISLEKAINNIAGLWENHKDIKNGKDYINELREDKRINDLYGDTEKKNKQ